MLPFQHKITEATTFMNNFTLHLICLQHNATPEESDHGSFVAWDYESLLRFLVKEYGLKEKATKEGNVEVSLTGDESTIVGKYSKSQFAAGFKLTDEDAVDTLTGEPLFMILWRAKMAL